MQLKAALAVVGLLVVAHVAIADPPGATTPVPPAEGTEAAAEPSEPYLGVVRIGGYVDNDQTQVLRTLGVLSHTIGHFVVNGSIGVDAVTSASVDVRSSPALSKVDVVTSASGRSSSSGGQMKDTRYQLTAGGGWSDGAGHGVNLTSAVASETDYASVSGGLNGSYDLDDRTLTLLGGVTLTDNWVSSVLDATLHRKMFAAAWSAGVARVLTPTDAIRVRYDGRGAWGDNSSPYRNVRFGDWTAQQTSQQITFANTIGSADGLPERLPETRISHAAVLEWVHSLAPGIGVHPEVRATHDTWGINSLGAAVDLRFSEKTWRLQLGYRFYAQSHAGFYESKYMQAPDAYANYTSDKELGQQIGHLGRLDFSRVLVDADGPGDTRMMLNMQLDVSHYRYPDFVLLPTRTSVFALIGLSWELP